MTGCGIEGVGVIWGVGVASGRGQWGIAIKCDITFYPGHIQTVLKASPLKNSPLKAILKANPLKDKACPLKGTPLLSRAREIQKCR